MIKIYVLTSPDNNVRNISKERILKQLIKKLKRMII